jgi:glycosyltransferase involved in cell wall biosynthesis
VDPSVTTWCADLHVHSACSENPTAKAIRFFRSRESFTAPEDVYTSARARGMDFVTITDHNTLNGSLAIAHLPGTFPGCEFDTWFPEDGCRVHVVALGIDERTFAEAMRARRSIYDLVACLRDAGVLHYIAHPLFDMTGKLTPDTVEKLLLLFNVLEGRNGARVVRCNGLLREIVAGLTPQDIWDMAERQGIEPYGEAPWRKVLTGGSDDHSGLFTAGAYTVAGGDGTPQGFLAAVARGECETAGEDGDARLLAHSIYATSFWRLREILRLDTDVPRQRALTWIQQGFGRIGRDVPVLEKTVRGVRSLVPGLYRPEDGRGPAWEDLLDREIGALLRDPSGIYAVGSLELNRRLYTVAANLAGDVLNLHLQPLVDPGGATTRRQRRDSSFAVAMVHFLELAYFIALSFQTRDRAEQDDLRRHFLGAQSVRPRVAVLTDTLAEVGEVSQSVRRLAASAALHDVELEVLTSTTAPSGPFAGGMNFQASAVRPLEPDPDYAMVVPPVLDVVDYLYERGFTAIHVSTAGGMGLLGLLAAKLLHLPVTGAFHVDLPRYAGYLYPGTFAARHAWRYVSWFYDMLDEVYAPTRTSARDLVAHGVDPRRVRVLPAWVDGDRFGAAATPRAGANGDGPEVVYAGRLAPEKGVHVLARAFREVVDGGVRARMAVAGDGPSRVRLERELAGYPVRFLGFVPQDDLGAVYGGADVLVLPSSTDTCGLVVLEAQAAGLPVITTDRGGSHEHVVPGQTVLLVPGDDAAALARALRELLTDDERRRAMGRAAREYVMGIARGPDAAAEAILAGLDRPAPRPGWRHADDLRKALSRRAGRDERTAGSNARAATRQGG